MILFVFYLVFNAAPLKADDLLYTAAQADCAAQMIFMNECSGKEKNLVYWSPREAFPSLGIGHFIWYPENSVGPYQESFPGFLRFAIELGIELPAWMQERPITHAPWSSRAEFESEAESARVRELRRFLNETKREQAQYILRRFCKIFPTILDAVDVSEQPVVQQKYDLLMTRPAGAFAMIDYVNFKGEGFRSDARYDGVGWGLAQVLLEMKMPDNPEQALEEFIAAAIRVLERRVAHAPDPNTELLWLPGWRNRIHRYREISCE
jgi:hypothetical protein